MNAKERSFVTTVRKYYRHHGRRTLPWRRTRNPYRILVSEIMLQQTQVERVIPKYHEFLKWFPSIADLAGASLGDVLRVWQGLGYNRRAKMLHDCAQILVRRHIGRVPRTMQELTALPGIGRYTAGAVLAFAYNTPVPIIETNIRSAYLHHFFSNQYAVDDKDILQVVERTLDTGNPREWYFALMDYGVYIKQTFGNPNARSAHHARQLVFKGSDREIRGAIVRILTKQPHTRMAIHAQLDFEDIRIDAQIEKLKCESLVVYQRGKYRLPD